MVSGIDSQLHVTAVKPPYDIAQRAKYGAEDAPEPPCPGMIRVIHIGDPNEEWHVLAKAVPDLRRSSPIVPVVVCVAQPFAGQALGLAAWAAGLGVRAVILEGEQPQAALRRWMTKPLDVGGAVVEWLDIAGRAVPNDVRGLVVDLVNAPVSRATVGGFLRQRRSSPRTVAKRLQRRWLPAPGEWFRLGRTLRLACRLQAAPKKSIMHHAHELGLEDGSTLRRAVKRVFGVSVGEVQATVGWEWLTERWWSARGESSTRA